MSEEKVVKNDKTAAETAVLDKIANDFEAQTSAEIMIAVAPNSGNYTAASWLVGTVLSLIGLTVYVWSPIEFFDDLAYAYILSVFFIGYILVAFVPFLQRILTTAKEKNYYTDLRAYALFAKNGVHKTKAETGMLLFVSVLEHRARLIADRGVKNAVAKSDLEAFEAELQTIWSGGKMLDNLAKVVAKYAPIFAVALPRQEDDENELSNTQEAKATPRFLHGGFGMRRFTVKPK
jgi:putative membrane protein